MKIFKIKNYFKLNFLKKNEGVETLLMLSQSELTPTEEPSQPVVLAKCVSCSQPITKENDLYLCPGPECGVDSGGCGSYFEYEGSLQRLCELCVFHLETTKK